MMDIYAFAFIVLVFVVAVLFFGIKIVPQTDVAIVERLGKFHKVLEGGLHFIIPLIDQVRSKVTIREQLINIGRQQVITKDNVNIKY